MSQHGSTSVKTYLDRVEPAIAPSHTLNEETVKIDPAGDAILIVGFSEPTAPTAHLLVSSKVLGLASPVFAVMFSPKFKEGSNLNSSHPCKVTLPEDHPEAMTLLCNCLHFRVDHIPRDVELSVLKTLAILCDKYDAARAISPWSILWLQRWETTEYEDCFEGLLAIIYALDCAEAFTKISRKAILDQVGSFDVRRIPDGFDMVPDSLVTELEVQRAVVQASLQKAIEDTATPLLGDKCQQRQFLAHAYFRSLQLSSLWPLSEVFHKSSLSTIMERISYFPSHYTNLLLQIDRRCTCDVCGNYNRPGLLNQKTKHLSVVTSLCLDCVKGTGSKLTEEDNKCRVPHSDTLQPVGKHNK